MVTRIQFVNAIKCKKVISIKNLIEKMNIFFEIPLLIKKCFKKPDHQIFSLPVKLLPTNFRYYLFLADILFS